MSFIEKYHYKKAADDFAKEIDKKILRDLLMTCTCCGEPIRDLENNVVGDLDEISISYYKGNKIGHLYFHPSCFEELAGVECMEQLKKDLK